MTTDKELIHMIQRSALTIYEHAEKMAGNYSTQTGLDIRRFFRKACMTI